MAWQDIAASETDANSPLNQTLMDKIRGDLDYLHSAGAQVKFLAGSNGSDDTPRDIVIDNEIDWRDRYIQALGIVTVYNVTANYLPGGADDNELGSRYTTINSINVVGHFDQWMYSSAGSSAKNVDPYLYDEWDGTNEKAWIWVNSTNGNLMLSIQTSRAMGWRNAAWNLRIFYSEDRGGH